MYPQIFLKRLKIKVKKKGATVQTRDGFYGDTAVYEVPGITRPPLVEVMFSPFRYDDLNISLASGYVDDLSDGYFLPTWMHLDGQNLGISKEVDGSRSVAFEVGASTTDIDGIFQDYGDMQVEFFIDEEGIRKLRENGMQFSISIPVKKPGGYYVRVAVQDKLSDAKGSAYQFIEVPDLKKNRLALSSLYLIDREKDASWLRAIATNESDSTLDASQQIVNMNPARKNFLPGDSFEYMTVIYNAKTEKENPPELESRIILYRDGVELYTSEAEAIDLSGVSDYRRIPVRRKLKLEESMQPGDYVLQFLLKDNNAKEEDSLTAQTMSFRITAQ